MWSILHCSPLLFHPYNNPYIEPRTWMSEIYDDISRDADKNIKHENIPKIKHIVNYKCILSTRPPPAEVRPSVPQMLTHNPHT